MVDTCYRGIWFWASKEHMCQKCNALTKQITDLCVLIKPHFPSDLNFRRREKWQKCWFWVGRLPFLKVLQWPWRHGAFNYLAQININTKPWSYWSYCNQTELMCSLNWSPITPVIRSRSVGAWAASRRQQQWGWKADMWKTLTVEQWLSLGPE